MEVKTLTLLNFRNYEQEEISFCPGINMIYGDNAQGKTNLLEAVSLFSQGKSPRTRTDTEMIRFGEKFFRLGLEFADGQRSYRAKMQLSADGKKSIWVNQVPVSRLSQLMSYLNVVMYSPEDLELVKGAPSVRRRFLDAAISQLYPNYLSALVDYQKALRQKNSLIRLGKIRGGADAAMMSVWNEQLADFGSRIALYRRSFLEQLSDYAAEVHSQISKEKLKIDYTPSIDCGIIEKEAKNIFFSRLEQGAQRELDAGGALLGIQRDDVRIRIGEKEARLFGSQGQQRTAALSLKLAQTEVIRKIRGEYPVLLLDDIMSELDFHRRQYLSERISGKQVLLTSTDTDFYENTENRRLFHIAGGRVTDACSYI